MSWIKYNLPCIKCDSSDALALDDKGSGYCFSCQTYFSAKEIEAGMPITMQAPSKYSESYSSKLPTLQEIAGYPIIALDDRNINEHAARYFGVHTSMSEQTGEPEYRYYPYCKNGHIVAYKRKKISDKRDQMFIGDTSDLELFGQQNVKGTQFVIITEGEEDALAAWQIMQQNKKNYNIVSLPNGANIKAMQTNYNWLYEFTQITVAFDNDDPGKKAAAAAAKIFDPGQLKVAEFKEFKDSNDYLKAGAYKEWWNAIYNATAKKPDGIVTISDIWEEATRRPEWGLNWPWPKLTQATYGRRGGEIYGVGAGTGCGKAIHVDELVPMNDGSLKRAVHIQIGDVLSNGIKVLNVSEIWKNRPTYKVSFDDGTSYLVDENHEWYVSTQKRRTIQKEKVETKIIAKNYLYPNSTRKRYSVDITPIQYEEQKLTVDPYLFGYWLGDGNSSCGMITVHTDDQYNIVDNYLTESVAYSKYGLKLSWLTPLLRKLGVLYNKHIPSEYLHSSTEQRMQLLRGLLDSDGSVENGTAYFYNTNSRLAMEVLELSRSLGYKSRMYTKNAKLYGKDCGLTYAIRIQQHDDSVLFRLDRKQKLLRRQQDSAKRKFISSVEYVGLQDTICYTVEGGLFLLNGFTWTHNSEWFKELVDQVIIEDDMPIGCAFLEEPAAQSAKRIAGKRANKKFFIPDADYSQDELEHHLRLLDNKLWLYDHNGYKNWDSIKGYFKYLARSVGVKDFILDNLTAVVAQEENEYSALNAIMEEMASLAVELDARIYYASHLRKASNTPHEEGGRVQLMEFKGSGAMGNWSNFIFGIERNTQHPDPAARNTSTLRVLKDRYTGLSTGFTCELWYDHDTGKYREKLDTDGVDLDY